MKWLVLGDIGRRSIYHVGDEAMADAAIEALSTRGASGVTLVATDAQVAADLYGLTSVERVGVGPGWSVSERDQVLEQSNSGALDRSTPLGRLDAAVATTDAVLISGGGNMNSQFGHHIDERATLARLARRHGKPLVVAAQTIGPALNGRERGLVGEILDYARAFAVRDDESYYLALELGGEPARVHRISDDAILLAPREEDLAVAASLLLPGTGYVVASFTSDAGRSALDRHDYLDLVSTTLDGLSAKLDTDVVLIPHIGSLDGPVSKVDELSDASILERSTSGRIRALAPMTARVAAAITGGALLSVSTRYHPLVFATAQGVPAIGISLSQYSTVRMRGALEPLGLGAFVLGPASWESVPEAAGELAARRAQVNAWLESAVNARRARQQQWWDAVAASPGDVIFPLTSPVAAAQLPADQTWAAPAKRALALFDALDGQRHTVADLTTQLENTRKRITSLTGRAQRAENRRIVRVADKLGDVVRTVAGWRYRLSSTHTGAKEAQPLLSVLIPIYNVESYLTECLTSVTKQSLTDLEIILIDDGSTDSSGAIAQTFAARDPRIRLIRQDNQGLGAVRNRGVHLARGKFLTFVDSDDLVPRGAFSALVDTLEASGSDLAIGGTMRLLPDGSSRTWQWARDLHARDQRTTIAETPRLLRDFYTWNKAYRAGFWHEHGFRFREGVLFEDQPVITEILCRAAAIDVLSRTTYHYRTRLDDSSLTGNMYALDDVRTRHQATRLTGEALDTLGVSNRIRHAWWWTLVEYHFPRYLKNTVSGEGAEYAAVVDMMREIVTAEEIRQLEGVSAAHRVLCYLALTTTRPSVARYLEGAGKSTSHARLERRGETTIAALPFHDKADADLPRDLNVVSTSEQRLVAVFEEHSWEDPCVLIVCARVGISQALPPERLKVTVVLVFVNGARRPVTHTGNLEEVSDLPRPSGVTAWYVMRISLDVTALEHSQHDALAGEARIEVELTWDELERSGVLSHRGPAGAAKQLTGSIIPATSNALELSWSRLSGLLLRILARDVSAAVSLAGEATLELELHSRRAGFDIVFVTVKAAGVPERRHLVRRTAPREYSVRLDLTWLEPGQSAHLVALDESGVRRNVHATAAQVQCLGSPMLCMTTTPGAQLRITRRVVGGQTADERAQA